MSTTCMYFVTGMVTDFLALVLVVFSPNFTVTVPLPPEAGAAALNGG